MEGNGNNIIGCDLSTSLKPETDFANERPHADVQACNSVFLNRSEITTIISEEASKAPAPTLHTVRSEQLPQKVLQERQQQETCHFLCFEQQISRVNSDKVHVDTTRPSRIHHETRSVSENPGKSQVKLAHSLLRILCSYYIKDPMNKNFLATNTVLSKLSALASLQLIPQRMIKIVLRRARVWFRKLICNMKNQTKPNFSQAISRFVLMSTKTTG